MTPSEIELLRHFVSTLSYRGHKALKDSPENYPRLDIGHNSRTPIEILNHMTYVLMAVQAFLLGDEYEKIEPGILGWEGEVKRFYDVLEDIDDILIKNADMIDASEAKTILQGPLADVMTHVGQLAMLRRLADSPIEKENFARAEIKAGKFFR